MGLGLWLFVLMPGVHRGERETVWSSDAMVPMTAEVEILVRVTTK